MSNFTVIIPYRNGAEHIGRLLACIPPDIRVIVVDDQSEIPLQPNQSNVAVIRAASRGYFSGAVNFGIAACDTDVLVLNQDVWLDDGWIDTVRQWQAAGYGIAGDGVMNHPAWPSGYVQGTCMYLSREAIKAVGPFNQRDYPLWGATAEWQLRACRLGFAAHPGKVPFLHHERSGNYGMAIHAALQQEPEKQSLFVRTPPAVSVIVACYNYGRYLSDAINSLLGGETSLGDFEPQSFQSFEIIIVNDGSTDSTDKIATQIANSWEGIRYIKRAANGGTAACYNSGIEAAHGKYITALSADDMMETNRLERMYRLMESNPHSVIYDDAMLFKAGQRYEHFKLPEYDFDRIMYKNGMHSGIMYSKEAWKEAGGYPEVFNDGREDWAFNVALGVKGYCGIHIADPLYLYRREGQNRTLQNSTPKHRIMFLGKLRGLFPKLYEGERPDMCCGSGSNRRKSSSVIAPARGTQGLQAVIGEQGMTLVEYLGKSFGKTPYGGRGVTPTRQFYIFDAGKHKLQWVDNRDVAALLNMRDKGHALFRLATINNAATEVVNTKEPTRYVEPVTPAAPVFAEKAPPPPTAIETVDIDLPVIDASEQAPEPEKPKRRYRRKAVEEKAGSDA